MSSDTFEYNRPEAGPATIGVLPSETRQPADPSGTVPQVSNRRRNDPFGNMQITWVRVDEIDTSSRRVRRALDSQVKAVKASIERYGNRVPILVHRKGTSTRYTVIDGYSRLEAAKLLGAEQVPVIVIADLPDVELRRLALSLNKLQETGQWDPEALRLEINEIIEIDGDLDLPGFEMTEVEAIRFGGGEGADPSDDLDKVSSLGTSPVTQPGDRWILGAHELRCGSAREVPGANAPDGGSAVDVIFTDPPYNVKINGHVRGASTGFAEFAEASGELTDAAFRDFLIETLGGSVAELKPGGVAFVCMDWRHLSLLEEALLALGLEQLNLCVWVKNQPGMGSLYRSQHELVFVGRKPGASHQNNVQLGKYGRNRSNVWHYAGATGGAQDPDDAFDAHPTVKPIRLVMDALLDVSRSGDVVLDPFLGSGTTLLAAERTGRLCRGVEIEPAYVDLAVRRWQEMTGHRATHAETGRLFDESARAPLRTDATDGQANPQEDF